MQKLLIYNYLYLVPMVLGAFAGSKAFKQARLRVLRPFALFLWATLLVEVFAICWKWYLYKTPWWSFGKTNLWIYNAFLQVRFVFMLWFYSKFLKNAYAVKMIKAALIPGVIWGLVNYFLLEGPNTVNYFSMIPFHIAFIILSLAYFHQLLQAAKIEALRRDPMVWISLGTFVYYSATLPFFICLEYVIKININLAVSLLYINIALNTLMYSFYLTSFLCKTQSPQ